MRGEKLPPVPLASYRGTRVRREVSKNADLDSVWQGRLPEACLGNYVFILNDLDIVQHSFEPLPVSPTDGWHRYRLPEVQVY